MTHDLKANKDNAIAFYKTAYLGDPATAVNSYVGDDYIQHNPLVGNGYRHRFLFHRLYLWYR